MVSGLTVRRRGHRADEWRTTAPGSPAGRPDDEENDVRRPGRKMGLNRPDQEGPDRDGPDREDDVDGDRRLAQSRDTGGDGRGAGDAESTTGTGTSEEFVGRVAGQDDGAERLSGAEARAFGAERGDGEPDRPSRSDGPA